MYFFPKVEFVLGIRKKTVVREAPRAYFSCSVCSRLCVVGLFGGRLFPGAYYFGANLDDAAISQFLTVSAASL